MIRQRALLGLSSAQRGLDPASVLVDDLSELRNGLECSVLAPAGDTGDALAVDSEADARADDEGDGRADDDFGLLSAKGLIVDPGRVGDHVDQGP